MRPGRHRMDRELNLDSAPGEHIEQLAHLVLRHRHPPLHEGAGQGPQGFEKLQVSQRLRLLAVTCAKPHRHLVW
jgi:hypothetical protein